MATKREEHAESTAQQAETNLGEQMVRNNNLHTELESEVDKNKMLALKIEELEAIVFEYKNSHTNQSALNDLLQAAGQQLQRAVVGCLAISSTCVKFADCVRIGSLAQGKAPRASESYTNPAGRVR